MFLLVFLAHFICADTLLAANSNQKGQISSHKLTTGHLRGSSNTNNATDVLANCNNPLQVANYRLAKSSHFIKIFFIELISLAFCLGYLKNNLKCIYSRHARFLKLMLYPEHVFW